MQCKCGKQMALVMADEEPDGPFGEHYDLYECECGVLCNKWHTGEPTWTQPRGGDASDVCPLCEDDGTLLCLICNGSGEGMYDGSTCRTCKGSGEVPCECAAEARQDARAAAEDAAYEAYKDRRKYGRLT